MLLSEDAEHDVLGNKHRDICPALQLALIYQTELRVITSNPFQSIGWGLECQKG
jgi:hypothetical protein